ncbi:fungal-specific transcription factor domain-containing protein [Coniochaeta sp. 2T2.1]|nr:fungal-specific transcription factor domain-containing protein [Coniochaeta sp. 2T2.1]
MSTTVTTPCTCDHLLHANARQWSLPLRRQADELVRLYFTRVHRTYPILHQPTFIRQYNLLWEPASAGPNISSRSAVCSGLCRQKSLDKVFPAMVNAVFALASLFASSSPEENSIRAAAFFKVTQQVDLLDVIDEEVGIELVQLLLLMGFYLQSTERFSKCWNMTGLAIRMAQNMGLQLSSQDARKKGLLASSPTQLESEMRIRVWYGCVLLDREISMSFGRPLMINNTAGGDYLKLPQAIDDEYLNEEAGGEWNLQPRDCPSLLESYIQTIKLYDILGRVLDREETKHATTATTATPSLARLSQLDTPPDMGLDTQSLLDLDNMIMEWLDALPSHLRYEPTSELARDNRALTPESIPLTHTHFSAQAKRLYARFLHVRVLILRPALEHLFHKQRHAQSDAPARPNKSVSRVQDLMLSDIAAQCVLSADSLVRCLDTYIRAKSLVAWWYNISYLHTCGSTLLMGRLCNFTGATVKQESLSATWEVCLRCISQYTGLSSIASKSFHLLKESARRLLPQPASDKAIVCFPPKVYVVPN